MPPAPTPFNFIGHSNRLYFKPIPLQLGCISSLHLKVKTGSCCMQSDPWASKPTLLTRINYNQKQTTRQVRLPSKIQTTKQGRPTKQLNKQILKTTSSHPNQPFATLFQVLLAQRQTFSQAYPSFPLSLPPLVGLLLVGLLLVLPPPLPFRLCSKPLPFPFSSWWVPFRLSSKPLPFPFSSPLLPAPLLSGTQTHTMVASSFLQTGQLGGTSQQGHHPPSSSPGFKLCQPRLMWHEPQCWPRASNFTSLGCCIRLCFKPERTGFVSSLPVLQFES